MNQPKMRLNSYTFIHNGKEITVKDVSLDNAREQAALKLAIVNKYSLQLLKQKGEE